MTLGIRLSLLALLGISTSPAVALAQQEAPLTDEMIASRQHEDAAAKRKAKEEALGDEYTDNPDWLQARFDAEEAAREKEADEAAAAKRLAGGDEKEDPGYVAGYRQPAGIGLSPHAAQGGSVLPTGVTPSMGAPVKGRDFRFDFHGYLQAGIRAGIGERDVVYEGQQSMTLHGDPVVPGGAFGWFEHTNTVPVPWAQMNFSFGNDVVEATAILGAWSPSAGDTGANYFQPPSKLGFNDAYITYTPDVGPVGLAINFGVFQERYGAMGEYDAGAYGTSLIANIYGAGLASTVILPFENDVTVSVEGSFKGDFNTPSVDIVPDQSNEFARAVEGSSYAGHGHLSFDFDDLVEAGAHGIYSWSQDDRGDELEGQDLYLGDNPRRDGSLTILGLDARFKMKRFGHLYLGGSHVIGNDAITVSNLVQVLNNGPGRDLARRFWSFDSGGNGTLTILGGQYQLSLGTLLRHPQEFSGDAPDLKVSLFGVYAKQENEGEAFEDSDMLKFGTEVSYSMLKWLALSARVDGVMPDLSHTSRSFGVITPKLLFRTGWDNRATVTLQYSGYLLGDDVEVRGDERLLNNPSGDPDPHLLALYGTLWW